jgi:hypothetical protein
VTLRELVESCGWPDDGTRELAQGAAEALLGTGLGLEAILVWIDQVYAQPHRFLSDLLLAPLARARLASGAASVRGSESSRECDTSELHQLYQWRMQPKVETACSVLRREYCQREIDRSSDG